MLSFSRVLWSRTKPATPLREGWHGTFVDICTRRGYYFSLNFDCASWQLKLNVLAHDLMRWQPILVESRTVNSWSVD
jgi:hypothetical protein